MSDSMVRFSYTVDYGSGSVEIPKYELSDCASVEEAFDLVQSYVDDDVRANICGFAEDDDVLDEWNNAREDENKENDDE